MGRMIADPGDEDVATPTMLAHETFNVTTRGNVCLAELGNPDQAPWECDRLGGDLGVQAVMQIDSGGSGGLSES